ncbi:stage III sporulation protein AF [Paenibacillus catalpae]|uniref:Stage III sporulation protein AF n=1 Tax=Paenibacillus catalpae TaxID=1045775 RepID=A0A1I2FBQ2_9BACL|nr:stage III sporulation protein AF [Paenibacillus catalpae]SFF02197.1 stage III sporulation protein AF [Paenibacillus catalpae]
MIAWLSDWLRDIIAVIMLAAFVELLLPNKAMLRYSRLVIGLLILLTIMSPILRLLQGDFNAKLKDGITHWDQLEAQREVKMPTLSDIQKKADELNKQQDSDAAALMEQTLESAMKDAVFKQTEQPVEAVEVTLGWEKQGQKMTPYVNAVLVTLTAVKKESDAAQAPNEDDVKEVTAIQVDINAKTEAGGTDSQQTDSGKEGQGEGWIQADPSASKEIRNLLAEGWGISPGNIQVRQRDNRN